MKDIVLKITGRTLSVLPRPSEGPEDDAIEFITEGTLSVCGEETRICYEETSLSGISGCKTTLKIRPGKVRLERSGDSLPDDSVMEFEKGKRSTGTYETPFGSIGMEILTSKMTGLEHIGNNTDRLSMEYVISLKGLLEARKELNIEVRGKKN